MLSNKRLTHGSLFSGIGGFDLAAEWAGFENIFHCDFDPFCRQALQYQFPNSDSYADITTTDFTPYRGRITVLTGGFPCQPFSLAGKRAGADDSRYLWPEMLRAIRQIRPTWVIGENVIGITSMVLPAETVSVDEQASFCDEGVEVIETTGQRFVIDQICSDLEQEGYAVQPIVIPACSVGAPHKRDRVWFLARVNEEFVASDTLGDRCDNGCCDWQGGHVPNNIDGNATESQSQRQGRQCGVGATGETVESAPDTDSHGCHTGWRNGDGQPQSTSERQGVQRDSDRSCQERTAADTRGERQERRLDPNRPCTSIQLRSARLCSRSGTAERQPTDWALFPTQPPIYAGDDGLPRQLAGRPISNAKWRQQAVKACGNAIVPEVAYEILRFIAEIEINS